eukprot:scaffold161480_cov38-Tisochrysis_lutea.AAC.1
MTPNTQRTTPPPPSCDNSTTTRRVVVVSSQWGGASCPPPQAPGSNLSDEGPTIHHPIHDGRMRTITRTPS